jgi:hypothetical protein
LLVHHALLDQVALDKYSFLRDAYLARRRDAQYDGAPPMEIFDDEAAEPPPRRSRVGSQTRPFGPQVNRRPTWRVRSLRPGNPAAT